MVGVRNPEHSGYGLERENPGKLRTHIPESAKNGSFGGNTENPHLLLEGADRAPPGSSEFFESFEGSSASS